MTGNAGVCYKKLLGLPLYRQEQMFKRVGIDQPRATLARWMIEFGKLIQPLINLMQEDLLASHVLHMDETHVQVLKNTGKESTSKSWMWVRCRSGPNPIIVFTPKSMTGKAINYLHNEWGRLVGLVGNPEVPLSNAFAENAI
jgi:hypothetical protein